MLIRELQRMIKLKNGDEQVRVCVFCVKRDTNHWSFFWHFLRLRALGVSCVIQTLGCVPDTKRKRNQSLFTYRHSYNKKHCIESSLFIFVLSKKHIDRKVSEI